MTPLTAQPPTRAAKGATPSYSTAIPPAEEAYWPTNFDRIWRFLYPWLEKKDADDAAKAANSSTKYPYPAGYSNEQKPGPVAGGAQVRPTIPTPIHKTPADVTFLLREATPRSSTSHTTSP